VVALKLPAAKFVEVCDQNEGAWKLVARELANRLFDRNRLIKPPNDKPKLFIISSVEARDVAREISSGLQYDCLPTVWNEGVFWAGGYPLEVLEEQVNKSDFAVAVAHFEDVVESRGGSHQAMRDNVLFELGMFIGRLGRHRSILAHPKLPNLTLPSDLHGIITTSYIPPTTPEELPSRLSSVSSEIRKLMEKYGVHKHPG
jgi:predicted nucleotide-binding protein